MLLRFFAVAFLLLFLLGASGCQFDGTPRRRLGCYPTSTVGTGFLDPEYLGPHGYRFKLSEKNGIVYTCEAGHIDVAHLRIAADWTVYLASKSFKCLMKSDAGFSFKLNANYSRYFAQFTYPENWQDLSQKDKEQIAREVSLKLGQYLAFTATTWHEIMTWFGYKCLGIFPEFPSAFSWEDSFSNLLGTHIAAQALRDTDHEFEEAMTLAIDQELEKLGIKSRYTAISASENARGEWFSGYLLYLVDMKRRNFDIGLDDGYVTPTIVPGILGCEGIQAQSYPVPNLDFLSEYQFSVKIEIEPRDWEKDKILSIVYPDAKTRKGRLEPVAHFARIMNYIQEDAVTRYGYNIGEPCEAVFPQGATVADINGDSKVNLEDFALVASRWLDGDNP